MAAGDAERLRRKMEVELRKRAADMVAAARTAFQEGKKRFLGAMTRERLSGPTGPGSLAVRTGQLRRSLDAVVLSTARAIQLTGYVGGGVPYARIHETGGTIIPKRAKYLAIPLGPAKTAAGVARAGPRAWPTPLVFIKTKKGKKLLVEAFKDPVLVVNEFKLPFSGATVRTLTPKLKTRLVGGERTDAAGKKHKTAIRPVFLLVDKVTLPARMNFRATFNREAEKTLAAFKAAVDRIARGGR